MEVYKSINHFTTELNKESWKHEAIINNVSQ